jgi:hypothetical protein
MNAFQRRLRWCWFLVAGAILFWLPVEDVNFTAVTIFSAVICCLGVLTLQSRWNLKPRTYAWLGFFAGLGVGPLGVLLMVFKIGLHSHSRPDFTIVQLSSLIQVTPIWGLIGFLLGLGRYLYQLSRNQ